MIYNLKMVILISVAWDVISIAISNSWAFYEKTYWEVEKSVDFDDVVENAARAIEFSRIEFRIDLQNP